MEKEKSNTISFMRAISDLYQFQDKNNQLTFDIIFQDRYDKCECRSGYHILITKYWSKLNKEWAYGIKAPYCPTISTDEENFLGNLFSTDSKRFSLSFGYNTPKYTIYKGIYNDPILSERSIWRPSKEKCELLLPKIKSEMKREKNCNRYNALLEFREELEECLERYQEKEQEEKERQEIEL